MVVKMMQTEIITSDDVPNRYKLWSKNIFKRIGPNITYGDGRHTLFNYSIRSPVRNLFIVNKAQYNSALKREKEDINLIKEGKFPTFSKKGIPSFTSCSTRPFDFSLGFWVPHRANFDISPGTSGCSGDIFISYEDIDYLANQIEKCVPEVPKRKITELCYNTALLHEIGHHLTLTNQPYEVVKNLKQQIDAISYEGMAGLIAYMLSTNEERYVLSEIAVHQPICYRVYLYFKHADVTRIFEYLATPGMIDQMPSALSHVFGGTHNLNGFSCFVDNDYDGVAVDWSDRGGNIIAGGNIKAVTTFLHGLFIAHSIDLLIGRYPKDVLIITNRIGSVTDYNIIPNNILILPEDKYPIRDYVKEAFQISEKNKIQFLLSKLPVDEEYVSVFRDRTPEIDAWVKSFSTNIKE